MKLTDLGVHITQVNNNLNIGVSHEKYWLRLNLFLKSLIHKLEKENLIDQVCYKGNMCSFRPCNIVYFKKLDRLNCNKKNYRKIHNQYLCPYSDLLISTSKGVLTLTEAKEMNIGGIILAKYVKKHE